MALSEQGQRRDFGERRFSEAAKYVARGWMPVQKPLLKDIQRKLSTNAYSGASDELIEDLKNDFALFTFCLRELGAKVAEDRRGDNPLDLLKGTPKQDLAALLQNHGTEIGSHDFIGMREVQLLRMKHQLISCATAELIARAQGVDPDLAFLAALFRQLGMALVAWNYPSTCTKALHEITSAASDSPVDFDEEIRRIAGFNPARLGREFLLSWCRNPALELALESNRLNSGDSIFEPEVRELGQGLRTMCEVGEALARVNDPNFYPRAVQRWREIEGTVIYYLGDNGVELIREHVVERYGHYVGFSPKLLSAAFSPQRQVDVVNRQHAEKLFAANDHVKRCPEEIRTEFKGVYDTITCNKVSVDALNGLVGRVVPKAGFLRGCVYILDSKRMVLVPRLRLGEARAYRPVSCSCGGERSHPVSEAFHCTMPIVEENVFLNGDIVSHVTGKFGNAEKIGILYLEMTEELRDIKPENRILFFKAIRQCLNDCLNLH